MIMITTKILYVYVCSTHLLYLYLFSTRPTYYVSNLSIISI